jgi:hypothetical protein
MRACGGGTGLWCQTCEPLYLGAQCRRILPSDVRVPDCTARAKHAYALPLPEEKRCQGGAGAQDQPPHGHPLRAGDAKKAPFG